MNKEKRNERIAFDVYRQEKWKLEALREDAGYTYLTDYIRALIENDAKQRGKTFKFNVNRGGYRERKSDQSS